MRGRKGHLEIAQNGSLILLPVLHTMLVIGYARIFAGVPGGSARFVRPLLIATLALHLAFVLLRGMDIDACPLGTRWEYCSLLALAITCIYFLFELRTGDRHTGVFLITAAFALQMTASVFMLSEPVVSPPRLGILPSVQALADVVGFAAIVVSSIYGLLYLFLYGTIKGGSYGVFFRRIPNLDTLSRQNYAGAALAALALGVSGGVGLWLSGTSAASGGAGSIAGTLAVWAVFASSTAARRFLHLGAKRLAYTTVLGLLLAAFLLLATGPSGGAVG